MRFWSYINCYFSDVYFFAANRYYHHIATNTWLGENISPAINDNNKTALDHYTINLPSGNDLIC